MIRSTATLACVGRRQAYFKDEFLSALEILNRGDLRPDQVQIIAKRLGVTEQDVVDMNRRLGGDGVGGSAIRGGAGNPSEARRRADVRGRRGSARS